MNVRILVLIVFQYCSLLAYGNLDSLMNELRRANEDTSKVQLLHSIGHNYRYENFDSAFFYYFSSLDIMDSIKNVYEGKDISVVYDSLYAISIVYVAKAFENQADYSSAMKYFENACSIFERIGNKKGIAMCYNSIGVVFYYKGNYDKAVEHYLKALKYYELVNFRRGMSQCYNNIGVIYKLQENYNKALEYYNLSLKLDEEIGDKYGISWGYNNLGNVSRQMGDYYDAISYYLMSSEIQRSLNDMPGLSATYLNIGNTYSNMGKHDTAVFYLRRSLKIDKRIGDKEGLSKIYSALASIHVAIADSARKEGNIRKANTYMDSSIYYGEKAYDIGIKIGSTQLKSDASEVLKTAYASMNNYKEAFRFAEIYFEANDTLYFQEKAEALAEMTIKYESEKKQIQIEKLEQQKFFDDKVIASQKLIILIGVTGTFIIAVFLILIWRLFIQKRNANFLLKEQNEEIISQHDQIMVKNALLESQKVELSTHRKNTLASLTYAEHIQGSLMPNLSLFKEAFADSFIFFRPKDIVSGDFYWAKSINGSFIFAASDCTGHGVPGAFMSIMGISFLNEIVQKQTNNNPAAVLEKLRMQVKDTLNPELKENKSNNYIELYLEAKIKDGMEIAICSLNENNKLTYSGANMPLFIIRDNKLLEYKPNDNPVGIYLVETQFENQTIQLMKNDIIYLFSDGYFDQFGGENNKKFLIHRLKQLLLNINMEPCEKQKEILTKTIEDWMGINAQIDDMMILGFKI